MRKLLLLTGDIAAGKTSFSDILSKRFNVPVFQKDKIKEVLGDDIGFSTREENLKLSNATMSLMFHIFSQVSKTGESLILEANFHEKDYVTFHEIAQNSGYDVLTLVLRGDLDVLYERYVHRMNTENRHKVHLSTTLHIKEEFIKYNQRGRSEAIAGDTLAVDVTNFSYQTDEELLQKLDEFMN